MAAGDALAKNAGQNSLRSLNHDCGGSPPKLCGGVWKILWTTARMMPGKLPIDSKSTQTKRETRPKTTRQASISDGHYLNAPDAFHYCAKLSDCWQVKDPPMAVRPQQRAQAFDHALDERAIGPGASTPHFCQCPWTRRSPEMPIADAAAAAPTRALDIAAVARRCPAGCVPWHRTVSAYGVIPTPKASFPRKRESTARYRPRRACPGVIPAQAGIHGPLKNLDSRLRGSDGQAIRTHMRLPCWHRAAALQGPVSVAC